MFNSFLGEEWMVFEMVELKVMELKHQTWWVLRGGEPRAMWEIHLVPKKRDRNPSCNHGIHNQRIHNQLCEPSIGWGEGQLMVTDQTYSTPNKLGQVPLNITYLPKRDSNS